MGCDWPLTSPRHWNNRSGGGYDKATLPLRGTVRHRHLVPFCISERARAASTGSALEIMIGFTLSSLHIEPLFLRAPPLVLCNMSRFHKNSLFWSPTHWTFLYAKNCHHCIYFALFLILFMLFEHRVNYLQELRNLLLKLKVPQQNRHCIWHFVISCNVFNCYSFFSLSSCCFYTLQIVVFVCAVSSSRNTFSATLHLT